MKDSQRNKGVIFALVERIEKQRLPRALSIRKKLEAGGKLDTPDLKFLEQVAKDGKNIKPLLDEFPEWEPLAQKMYSLYLEIVKMHQENSAD